MVTAPVHPAEPLITALEGTSAWLVPSGRTTLSATEVTIPGIGFPSISLAETVTVKGLPEITRSVRLENMYPATSSSRTITAPVALANPPAVAVRFTVRVPSFKVFAPAIILKVA